MPRTKEPPRVAVLVGTSTGWGRSIVRGIANYANKHGPWHLWVEGAGQTERLRLPQGWAGEGIIARVADRPAVRLLDEAAVPTVNVSGIVLRGTDYPRVASDLAASGHLAAEYLLDRGLRHFGYVGLPRLGYVRRHYRAFQERLAAAGCSCSICPAAAVGRRDPQQRKALVNWLGELPSPAGILTWATPQGRDVLDACRWAGLLVPEQLAVLSGDDDPLLAETCSPPLSGIAGAGEQIGHEAAAMLDRLMRRRRSPKRPTFIPPNGVVTRRSTETLAMENDDLVQAVAYIRDHATEPIRVEDVTRAVVISRRQLERYFQETLGRTPAAEIRRVRLERAKELLTRSDLSIAEVAQASGFGTAEYLATLLKTTTGLTPLKYRSRIRGR